MLYNKNKKEEIDEVKEIEEEEDEVPLFLSHLK